jgi:hypothetical protein
VEGCWATLIDLYQLVAASQGMAAHQLPPEQRRRLAEFAVSQDWPGFSITTGSNRGPDPIEVVDYDPGWPGRYELWRQRLTSALSTAAVRREHVGSTAVPGLPAKPVIDSQVSVTDLRDEPRYAPQLETPRRPRSASCRIVEDSLPGPPCLAEFCRTIEDLVEGVAEDWW